MTRRSILWLVLLILAPLTVWAGYFTYKANTGARINAGTSDEIKSGSLGSKYFTKLELEALNIAIDLNRVLYLADLDLERLMIGCPVKDCISSIDGPSFESAAEADRWLHDESLVVGIKFNGIVKAHPIRILNWHEIVNDSFNDAPVVITYCPLCNSALAFLRPMIGGEFLEFGVSGRLYKSDLVMYDRKTGSFWSQLEGRAIIGPLAGEKLRQIPLDIIPWGLWRDANPATQVLVRPTFSTPLGGQKGLKGKVPTGLTGIPGRFFQNYDEDPYSSYKADDANTFSTPLLDSRLSAKVEVIGIELDGRAKAYPKESLKDWSLINDKVRDVEILIVREPSGAIKFFKRRVPGPTQALEFVLCEGQLMDRQTGTLWDFSGKALSGPLAEQQLKLEEIVGVPSFWFAWLAFHPQTELFSPDETKGK